MDIDSYFAEYGSKERSQLVPEAYARFRDYDNALFDFAERRGMPEQLYLDLSALLPAIIAAEDGHYYETESDIWSYVFEPTQASRVKSNAEKLVKEKSIEDAVKRQKTLLESLPDSTKRDALVFSVCYILCFSSVSDVNRKLLKKLFFAE